MPDGGARAIRGISGLAEAYPVWLCDVWGVIHNGVERFAAAIEALEAFRAGGGRVALITNAPRPASSVAAQLETLGIGERAYDLIVTSGDVTLIALAEAGYDRVHHLGPDRDLPLFAGLAAERVSLERAEAVVCTGLLDDTSQTPEHYRSMLEDIRRRGLVLYCANPDRVVRRGDDLFFCAGALAELYRDLGGEIIVAGKPHAPIYEVALDAIAGLAGRRPGRREVLMIGDGIDTDMAGAAQQGLDALFVTGGIHADEAGPGGPDGGQGLKRRLAAVEGLRLAGVMPELKW